MTIIELYDIEGSLEKAIAPILAAAGLQILTSQSTQELQKERPRVELVARLGAGQMRWLVKDIGDGNGAQWRDQAWRATLAFSVITDAEMQIHTAYRARVRSIISAIGPSINGAGLPNHKVQIPLRDEGSSPLLRSTDGYYRTDLNYGIDVAIQANAWDSVTL